MYLRDSGAGIYRTSAFLLARVSAELPYIFLFSGFAATISYWMFGFQNDAGVFFTWVVCVIASTDAATALLTALGAMSANFEMANLLSNLVLVILLLFDGFYINLNNLPGWCSWVHYLSFLHYGVKAAAGNIFAGLRFTCTEAEAQFGCVLTVSERNTAAPLPFPASSSLVPARSAAPRSGIRVSVCPHVRVSAGRGVPRPAGLRRRRRVAQRGLPRGFRLGQPPRRLPGALGTRWSLETPPHARRSRAARRMPLCAACTPSARPGYGSGSSHLFCRATATALCAAASALLLTSAIIAVALDPLPSALPLPSHRRCCCSRFGSCTRGDHSGSSSPPESKRSAPAGSPRQARRPCRPTSNNTTSIGSNGRRKRITGRGTATREPSSNQRRHKGAGFFHTPAYYTRRRAHSTRHVFPTTGQ